MKNNATIYIAVGFFGLALVSAHVVSWLTGSQFWGAFAYPVVWLLMIIVMALEHIADQHKNSDE